MFFANIYGQNFTKKETDLAMAKSVSNLSLIKIYDKLVLDNIDSLNYGR